MVGAYSPNVSAAIITPSLYLIAITDVPVTMGDLRGGEIGVGKGEKMEL